MTSSGIDAFTVASREDALDFMGDYPGYGQQRLYTSALAAEQVSSAGAGCCRGPVAAAVHPDDGRELEWDGVDVFPPTAQGRIARKDVYSSSGTPRVRRA